MSSLLELEYYCLWTGREMGTLVRLIFCALIISGKMLTVQSAVYSTPDSAMKFSQCLIDKMSESRFFTFGDRSSMIQVADVMSQALLNKQQTVFSGKILVVAFVTSMADVIVSEEAAKNVRRKDVYASALEQCSLSAAGYIDTEFINEALRIMSALEKSKLSKFDETSAFSTGGARGASSNFQTADAFNPLPVQPSRVQAFYAPEVSYPNMKTTFEQPGVPYGSAISSSSQSGTNSGYQVQYASEIGLPASSGATGLSHSGGLTPQSVGSSLSTFQRGFRTGNLPQYDVYSSVYDTSSMSQPANIPSDKGQYGSFPLGFDTSDLSQPESLSVGSTVGDISQPGSSSLSFNADKTRKISSGSDKSSSSQSQILPSSPDISTISETESDFVFISSPEVSRVGSKSNTSEISEASLESLTIPQTKESSVIVVPPKDHEIMYPPSDEVVFPQPEDSTFPKTPSASLPYISEEDPGISATPTFENIVLNILTNSSSFRETFNPEISKENAINLARAIAEQSLAGYDLNIINQALISVSDEISKVTFNSPENYALALSNALASALKLNNLPVLVDGSQLAASFLSNIDNSQKSPPQAESFEEPYKSYVAEESAYPDWEGKQVDFDFQAPPLSPEDTDEEIFSQSLARYLSNSGEIADFFCSKNSTEERVKIYFTIIKDSLTDYGPQISSVAAGVASNVLSELSEEDLCSTYANTIAEIIAEVFDENGIHNANALDIGKKMEFSLSQQQIIMAETKQTENVSLSSSAPAFQSSPNSFDQSDLDVNASSIYFNQPPGYSNFSGPEQQSPLVSKIESTSSVTIPYTTEISEEEFASAMTLSDTIDNLSEAYATNNSTELASEDVIDQEALSEYLFDAFESALEAYTSEDKEQTETSVGTVESTATEETAANTENDNTQTQVSSQIEAKNRTRNPQNKRRKKKRRTTQQPDIMTPLSVQAEQYEGPQDDNSTLSDSSTKDGNSHSQSGSSFALEDKFDPQTNAKLELVELQPSFQSPVPQSANSSSTQFQQASGTVAYNLGNEDASVTFAREVSQIAASTVAYIRSENVNITELCGRLNDLAPLVNIPPLDYCDEVAAIDYLLNVLRSMTYILKGV